MASSSHALIKEDMVDHASVEFPEDDNYDEEEEEEEAEGESVAVAIQSFAEQVLSNREAYVKRRVHTNKERLKGFTETLSKLDEERKRVWEKKETSSFLALCNKSHQAYNDGVNYADRDGGSDRPISIITGFQTGSKPSVRPMKLPRVENVPPYTSWIYLDRNQRMTEDQSVVGRRRIYYDSYDNETKIASDSEEEDTGDEDDKDEPKHDFSLGEDALIWMTVRELGSKSAVWDELSEALDVAKEETKARYGILLKDPARNELLELSRRDITPVQEQGSFNEGTSKELVFNSRVENVEKNANRWALQSCLDEDKIEPKDLLTAMDSFDNLFCRRCLVFDCRLHGCSQAIVHPCDRQLPWTGTEEEMPSPCSTDCYLLADTTYITGTRLRLEAAPNPSPDPVSPEAPADHLFPGSDRCAKRSRTSSRERSCSGSDIQAPNTDPSQPSNIQERKSRPHAARRFLLRRAKQRRDITTLSSQPSQEESAISLDSGSQDESPQALKEEESSHQGEASNAKESERLMTEDAVEEEEEVEFLEKFSAQVATVVEGKEAALCRGKQVLAEATVAEAEVGVGWSVMEKGLYDKGLQIFGGNSCLIARNLLQDCKTCAEVAKYTLELKAAGFDKVRRISDSLDTEAASRARLYGGRRKKGARKLKYTFKSVVHPHLRKRMTNGRDQTCRQYTPCNCLYTCGKQCPCLLNGTCCEKYCGCSKSCKNRFRGCHCAKSNCCSRQCPCFAAGRECDPDVCRNCWIGCGDGTIAGPPPRGDVNATCHNMKLMLKQQQRVLLGRSAVAGWGAFLKNPVAKHEYLGEYTGELISHREADKRGKIYDREDSSFLFNLNDQYVLDACRKGDKLKFANHSLQPNCYAKVVMVSGDHRVGIFAKERITAGEELFYDYQYEPDRAPKWAKKPDDPSHKHEDTPSTTRRAQKAA